MASYKIAYRAATKAVLILAAAANVPAGYADIGSVTHAEVEPTSGMQSHVNHVLYQHIQDLLYKQGEYNMAAVVIKYDVTVSGGPDITLKVGDLVTVPVTITPTEARFQERPSFVSSAPAVAAIDSGGQVKGLTVGTATITVTYGTKTDTVAVTVEAAGAD